MILIFSTVAAILICVTSIFIETVILKIILITLLIFILVIILFEKNRTMKNTFTNSAVNNEIDQTLQENKRLSTRLQEIEGMYFELKKTFKEKEEREKILVEDASYLCTSLPLMKELANLVIVKTEESAINLTENIFQISNKSSQVGIHISNFLKDMFSGDKSLKNNVEILNIEMQRINKLIDDFSAINKKYTVDMKKIEENVLTINNFLSGIRDVSDRTGLLAINSSIEAARVGTAGKGFSVLAGEIQGLARSSKDISLQIDDVVKVISQTVEESFSTLESEIALTLNELSRTQTDLNQIAANLNDKVSDVENHVKDSDNLSKTVTEQLNHVSVNMQYQDITRQIMEHIISTLYFYRTKLEENEPQIIAMNDNGVIKEEVIEKASSFFTIDDEWRLFGLEKILKSTVSDKGNEDFKGNVELF